MASRNLELEWYIEQELQILLPALGEEAQERIEEQARRDYESHSPEERTELVELYVRLAEQQAKMNETRASFDRQFPDEEALINLEARPKNFDPELIKQYFTLPGAWLADMKAHRETWEHLQEIFIVNLFSEHHQKFVQEEIDHADTVINALTNQIEDMYERYTSRSSGSIMSSVGQVLRNLASNQQPEDVPPSPTTNFLRQLLEPDCFALDEDWRGVHMFGKSMPDGVGLWLQYDRDEKIVDVSNIQNDPLSMNMADQNKRVVRKDAQFRAWSWYDQNKWHGNSQDVENRIPLEYWLQQKCANASDKHFVRMRAWHQDHERCVLSLYNEYCPHKDLWHILAHYTQMIWITGDNVMIPEPTLWFIFQRLVEQCLIMQQGSIHKADSSFKQIVHCDTKTANIFLDFPDRSEFPTYPTPKLADFGLAVETYKRDPRNPKALPSAGTRPLKAPEQLEYNWAKSSTGKGWSLLHWTNIYGIGTLMFSLMCADEDVTRWEQPDFENPDQKWEMTEGAEDEYSDVLQHLVMSCLEWRPPMRPTAEELYADINASIKNIGGEVGEGLRRARNGENAISKHALWYPEEEYKLGFAMTPDDLPVSGNATAGVQRSTPDSSIERRAIPQARHPSQRMVLSGSSGGPGRVQKTTRSSNRRGSRYSFDPSQ